jgi:hypothetical protein
MMTSAGFGLSRQNGTISDDSLPVPASHFSLLSIIFAVNGQAKINLVLLKPAGTLFKANDKT